MSEGLSPLVLKLIKQSSTADLMRRISNAKDILGNEEALQWAASQVTANMGEQYDKDRGRERIAMMLTAMELEVASRAEGVKQ